LLSRAQLEIWAYVTPNVTPSTFQLRIQPPQNHGQVFDFKDGAGEGNRTLVISLEDRGRGGSENASGDLGVGAGAVEGRLSGDRLKRATQDMTDARDCHGVRWPPRYGRGRWCVLIALRAFGR
jgi:hypothetical protein